MGEQPLPEVVGMLVEAVEQPEAFEIASDDRVRELEGRVESLESELREHRRVIGELAEYIEILSIALDNSFSQETAQEVWADEGGDVSPVVWEENVVTFKRSRYE
jgi:hypothetical protein